MLFYITGVSLINTTTKPKIEIIKKETEYLKNVTLVEIEKLEKNLEVVKSEPVNGNFTSTFNYIDIYTPDNGDSTLPLYKRIRKIG